jgi:molybdate transport system substrate-binding protein
LPPALQDKVVMAAGIATGARQGEAAADLIRFLASPAASGALKAHGMAP